ncbi:A/G-specific adenine glycosylase [Paenibacillus sp. JX-17]|uniref:Adenine DNA glycosylase n=1 Tax=Paenibacillus lacisoli TaxID=3064525 RepID=A0ABT9CKV2_9BACL|nr:A/G-specific adenine glycosylase [Paenibacillus sp. JX-17]MDO7908263.1 A/G-specific adenine glycosylase [Paenibacillus sp. JX-17]
MNNTEHKSTFSTELLNWYMVSKRDLPWRRHRDPYMIWISEIMLQQTRVDTVIPYFQRFTERFPTIQALAEAPEEDVLKHWEGLGYYSRARNLQLAARQIMELYDGRMPDDVEAVAGLKGVGPYTTGAIMSIAFNRPVPAVDGNVMRVLSRYFLIEDDIMKQGTRKQMEALVRELFPEGQASHFTQAMMELGALVCTPKSPHCLTCPVMEHCAGRLAGVEETLPVKTKAKPPRPEERLVALVEGRGSRSGRVLVRQRPAKGLLARMWELPHVLAAASAGTAPAGDGAMDRLAGALREEGVGVAPVRHLLNAEHTFSHIHWNLQVFQCEEAPAALPEPGHAAAAAQVAEAAAAYAESGALDAAPPEPVAYRWITAADMDTLAFPNVFLKILRNYFSAQDEQ